MSFHCFSTLLKRRILYWNVVFWRLLTNKSAYIFRYKWVLKRFYSSVTHNCLPYLDHIHLFKVLLRDVDANLRIKVTSRDWHLLLQPHCVVTLVLDAKKQIMKWVMFMPGQSLNLWQPKTRETVLIYSFLFWCCQPVQWMWSLHFSTCLCKHELCKSDGCLGILLLWMYKL